MKSQVTTGHGDAGETRTLDGRLVSKAHPIMECVGALDAFRAQTALVRAQLAGQPAREDIADFLAWLLHVCFVIGSQLSDPANKKPQYHPRVLAPADLAKLEAEQARLEALTLLPKSFIVAASNPIAAQVDIACTAARMLERQVIRLREPEPELDVSVLLPFLNRLSDYLFILARALEDGDHLAVDYKKLD